MLAIYTTRGLSPDDANYMAEDKLTLEAEPGLRTNESVINNTIGHITVGSLIRQERLKKSWDLVELSDRTEISLQRLISIEKGGHLTVEEFVVILKVLAEWASMEGLFARLTNHIKTNHETRLAVIMSERGQAILKSMRAAAAVNVNLNDYRMVKHLYELLKEADRNI